MSTVVLVFPLVDGCAVVMRLVNVLVSSVVNVFGFGVRVPVPVAVFVRFVFVRLCRIRRGRLGVTVSLVI
ncbi:hypothetical protein [Halalkalicoccus sp. NIPERK01]|uniref:hypothetical protein n=1 Tax=Halalkalicoccus sp. NIPERK01 TaxID=3053469 RepID=UPI00256F4AA5|nr:hypothetical protein [Halalkalicoccus sp. NIPERK01]MDL5363222.1 hypothetical protein [Halalkalicoccus sp. NIPERK01]